MIAPFLVDFSKMDAFKDQSRGIAGREYKISAEDRAKDETDRMLEAGGC
jgi:hypothetical protein